MPRQSLFRLSVTILGLLALVLAIPGSLPCGMAATIVSVIDRDLDLASQIDAFRSETGPPRVDLGPRLVVGEGASSSNHTVIRVLNAYGVSRSSSFSRIPVTFVAAFPSLPVSSGILAGISSRRRFRILVEISECLMIVAL